MRRLALGAFQHGRNIYANTNTNYTFWRWPLSIVGLTVSASLFPILESRNHSQDSCTQANAPKRIKSEAAIAYTEGSENDDKIWNLFSIFPLVYILVHAEARSQTNFEANDMSKDFKEDKIGNSNSNSSGSSLRSYLTGFRTKVIGEYENRLRKHSSPQKIFEYFASANGQMTPEDLVRALTPFIPGQDDSILGSRNFKYNFRSYASISPGISRRYKDLCENMILNKETPVTDADRQLLWRFRQKYELPYEEHLNVLNELDISNEKFYGSDSLVTLVDLSGDGLISFAEFQVLLLLLLCKEKTVVTLFSEMDIEQKGFLNFDEFLIFLETLQKRCFGKSKLKRWNTNTLGFQDRDGLILLRQRIFENETKGISYEDFISLVSKIRVQVQKLEYNQFDKDHDGYLTPYEFALCVIASHSREQFRLELLERSEELKGRSHVPQKYISFEEFCEFEKTLDNIDALAAAIEVRKATRISSGDFATIAKTTTNVQLSDTIVEVMFLLLNDRPEDLLTIFESGLPT